MADVVGEKEVPLVEKQELFYLYVVRTFLGNASGWILAGWVRAVCRDP